MTNNWRRKGQRGMGHTMRIIYYFYYTGRKKLMANTTNKVTLTTQHFFSLVLLMYFPMQEVILIKGSYVSHTPLKDM